MDRLELETCTVDLLRRVVRGADGLVRLSPKEASLLGYLAERPGTTVSREELLREVWGYREGVMSRTLDTTVRTLRAKIEADRTTPSHVLTDPGGGYRFEPSRPAPATAGPPPITAQAPPMQEPNRFVGRVYDVSQIEGLYADPESGVRLVTLIGTAGVGKTRLARRVSRTMSQRGMFPGGVWLADLIGCTTPDDATHAVALAVADPEDAPRVDGEALGAQLAGLGQALLVLDNVDSVVEPVAGLVTRWLDRAPGLRVLVTSRERLRLRAEHCHALDPLSAAEAFELLLDRAQAASLALDAEGEACLEELARRLEGLPLALELAAARLPALGPRGVVDRLELGFSFLGDESRDLPVRHTSLHRAIQVSWDLLPSWARDAWMQTSIFVGGFDLPAANVVVDITRYSNSPPVEQVLYLLAERGLIRRTSSADLRFTAFDSLRSFARKRLDLAERGPGVRLRHASWYLRLAEQLTGLSGGPAEPTWYRLDVRPQPRCEQERNNLLGAWQTLCERGPADHTARLAIVLCCGALAMPLPGRLALLEQGRGRLAAMPVGWRARYLLLTAALHLATGDAARAQEEAERALLLGVESGETPVISDTLDLEAQALRALRRPAEAQARYERALALVDDHADAARRALLLIGLAGALRDLPPEPDTASRVEDLYTRALALFRRSQAGKAGQGQALGHLGELLAELGRLDEARVCVDDAVRMTAGQPHTLRHLDALLQQGSVAAAEGDLAAAEAAFQRALEIARTYGAAPHQAPASLGAVAVLLLQTQARAALERLEAPDLQDIADPVHRHRALALRGIAECLASRPTSALASLGEAERGATAAGDRSTAATAAAMTALAQAIVGRTEVARHAAGRLTHGPPAEARLARLIDTYARWVQTPPGIERDDLRRLLVEIAIDSPLTLRGVQPIDAATSVARALVARLLRVNA